MYRSAPLRNASSVPFFPENRCGVGIFIPPSPTIIPSLGTGATSVSLRFPLEPDWRSPITEPECYGSAGVLRNTPRVCQGPA